MRKLIYTATVAVSAFVLIQSCSKSGSGNNPGNGGGNSTGFDRKGMLTNMSNNVIIPAYTAYQTATTNLDAAITAFTTAPDAAKLTAAQAALKTAYLQWQSTSEFEFGPAGDANLSSGVDTYPTNVGQINTNISSNTYNPDLLANLSAKGLPAIDYLLFGIGADNNTILTQYTTDAAAANRKTLLGKLSAELKANAAKILTAWNGTYKSTFLNATGTDVGSSAGQMVNQLVYDYEFLKNDEIGIPAGTQSMGTVFPEKVQAYYSKISLQLLLAHLQGVLDVYTGKDGLGFDDYVASTTAKYTDGTPLNDAILKQFATAKVKLQTLTDPLSDNIKTNPTAVTAAYAELQKLTVMLKTDMPSALGILITFGDTDGD
jgi:predicted lipoprotein